MKNSIPLFRLKRNAKQIAKDENIPLHTALDMIAGQQGFNSWSHMTAQTGNHSSVSSIYKQIDAGDMVLLGARPGHGKTLLALSLVYEAIKQKKACHFYSLYLTHKGIEQHLSDLEIPSEIFFNSCHIDCSDSICADHIIKQLNDAPRGCLIAIDYLQALDEKRSSPDLQTQVNTLNLFAKERGLSFIFTSQINRNFQSDNTNIPELIDVRLPNPVDLTHFNKTCFFHDGNHRFETLN